MKLSQNYYIPKSNYDLSNAYHIWRPPSLSKLTLIILYIVLTHLRSDTTIYYKEKLKCLLQQTKLS